MSRCGAARPPQISSVIPPTNCFQRGDDDSHIVNENSGANRAFQSVHDFLSEVACTREDGYFVHSNWLLGLGEKEKESLIRCFSKYGYTVTSDIGTTILFEMIDYNTESQIVVDNPSGLVKECKFFGGHDGRLHKSTKEDVEGSSNIEKMPGISSAHNPEDLLKTSGLSRPYCLANATAVLQYCN
jgi:hypothetical protein